MNSELFWPRLKQAFGNQKVFWATQELPERPGTTDRVLHYLISYFESPDVARDAVRIFRGVQLGEFGNKQFSGWNEVRVSTLREIDESLKQAGAVGDTWELALTIKDFLQNAWSTLDTIDLTNMPQLQPDLIDNYLAQLKGIPDSWDIMNERNKMVVAESPVRACPKHSNFYKRFLKYRKRKEPVFPACVTDFLEYCWKKTAKAPFEEHSDRVLSRLGVINLNDAPTDKLRKFEDFTTSTKPVSKHKHLIQLAKVICVVKDPDCPSCPVADQCAKKGF
jgi:hypothetical protein